jgi:hypothetical protein
MDYFQKYPGVLAAETPASLSQAATDIDVDQLVIVVVGDRAAIEKPLQGLGYQVVPAPAELTE